MNRFSNLNFVCLNLIIINPLWMVSIAIPTTESNHCNSCIQKNPFRGSRTKFNTSAVNRYDDTQLKDQFPMLGQNKYGQSFAFKLCCVRTHDL